VTIKRISLRELEKKIYSFRPDPGFPDDSFGWITVKEALAAARQGNYGVGACLIGPNGRIIQRGHNHMVHPYSRTDQHAEMNVLTRYETHVKTPAPRMRDFILYSSLEPCPMCLTRIIYTGVKKVYYLAEDPTGGMVRHMKKLPIVFRQFAKGRIYRTARCSPVLRGLARETFAYTARALDKKFREL